MRTKRAEKEKNWCEDTHIFTVIIRECWPSRISILQWISMYFVEFLCVEYRILIDLLNEGPPHPWFWLLSINYFNLAYNESKSFKMESDFSLFKTRWYLSSKEELAEIYEFLWMSFLIVSFLIDGIFFYVKINWMTWKLL